jgi:ATP-dependent DNA ligase
VKIWDKGKFEQKAWEEKEIEFTLDGKKLKGRYVLVRLKRAGEKSWLLLKGRQE